MRNYNSRFKGFLWAVLGAAIGSLISSLGGYLLKVFSIIIGILPFIFYKAARNKLDLKGFVIVETAILIGVLLEHYVFDNVAIMLFNGTGIRIDTIIEMIKAGDFMSSLLKFGASFIVASAAAGWCFKRYNKRRQMRSIVGR